MIVVQTSTSICAVHEVDHRIFQFPLGHLPVADAMRASGTSLRSSPAPVLVDGLDAVVQEEDLPAAVEFAAGSPCGWRRWLYGARRRYDSCGDPAGGVARELMSRRPSRAMCSVRGMGVAVMRQDIHVHAQPFEPLLVLDAETLLLVDDQQPQVLEADVLAEQPMRADEDVDLAGHVRV